MLTGLLLKESLEDESVLALVQITNTERWEVNNAAPDQPQIWTALSFEAEEKRAEAIAEAFSRVLKPTGWYLNYSAGEYVYVVFPRKVFRYRRGDQASREQAIRFGRTLNIPANQLEWGE